jgi:hypothetical protein
VVKWAVVEARKGGHRWGLQGKACKGRLTTREGLQGETLGWSPPGLAGMCVWKWVEMWSI